MVLEELGITKINAKGEMFDPNFHNAVLTGNDPSKQDGEILEEYQEGFMMKNERVIRYSVVQINKGAKQLLSLMQKVAELLHQ